ncbi:MAG: hypothetical protein IJI85_10205 [Clostridia bacterium]|nr:hypothetical protein [Lentisphaeria bacterium]MBR0422932.1 hypothetical protein [Clostridia bacterium]
MNRAEAVAVLREYGSDAEAGARAAREDWKTGRWPLFRETDFAGLVGSVLGAARGRIWEDGYRRMIEALCLVEPDKARRDLEKTA